MASNSRMRRAILRRRDVASSIYSCSQLQSGSSASKLSSSMSELRSATLDCPAAALPPSFEVYCIESLLKTLSLTTSAAP